VSFGGLLKYHQSAHPGRNAATGTQTPEAGAIYVNSAGAGPKYAIEYALK